VYLTPTDIEIMRKRDVKVSHNIVSNLKLANGISPVPDLIREGVTVSLGTDSASSNNSLDMFETMKFAALSQKFRYGDPTVLPASQTFRMATIEGGKALCWDDLGWLKPGFLADIVTVEIGEPHVRPLYDEYSHLVYAVKASDVSNVVVNGDLVVEDGSLTTLDRDRLLEEVNKKALELGDRALKLKKGGKPL
jgi:5-methylthioadenosine/S-adenosylhomocysteine deaminase